MFPRSFSLFWSIVTKKKKKQHTYSYIFLTLAKCQKQHCECVAVSIKEYRTFGGTVKRFSVFIDTSLLQQKRSNTWRLLNSYRISGNSFTRTATSIWMEGVSSRRMMSARWHRMLSNQDELDSWNRENASNYHVAASPCIYYDEGKFRSLRLAFFVN